MKLQDIRYKNIDEKSKLITDNLGNKIDNGVRELVVLLNYHKIGTTQSCWGHKNWGLPYPWVDIHKKYLGNILEIIEGLDIETENIDETIRIQPKIKTLKKGREIFKGLKNKLKHFTGTLIIN